MKNPIVRGQTGVIAFVFVADTASTTGGGKTGLTNASAGLLIAARREKTAAFTAYSGANVGTVTTLGTWADPGAGKVNFKEMDSTNAPGMYEMHFVDLLFSTSDTSRKLVGMLQVTGGAPSPFEVGLWAFDHEDGVRGGLTALPNAAAAAANGLPTFGAGAGQINPSAGKVPATVATGDGADAAAVKTTLAAVTFPSAVASQTVTPGWYTPPLTTLGANAPAGWINAAAVAAAALNGKGDWSTSGAASPAAVAAAVVAAGPVNWPALAITPAGQVSLAPPTDGMTGGPKVMRGPLQLAADDPLINYTATGSGAHWLVTISNTGEGQRVRILATDGSGNITSYAGTLWTALDSTTGYTRYFDADFRADVGYVAGNARAATGLQAMCLAVFTGVVSGDAAPTAFSFTANTTTSPGLSLVNGFYSTPPGLVIFYSGTEAVKASRVTGYSVSGAVGTFGLGASIPGAPAAGDNFAVLSLG